MHGPQCSIPPHPFGPSPHSSPDVSQVVGTQAAPGVWPASGAGEGAGVGVGMGAVVGVGAGELSSSVEGVDPSGALVEASDGGSEGAAGSVLAMT